MSITNANHLCISCMREKADDGVCPYCGFDESQYEPSPHHLQPHSILGGKCLIGRVLGEGGFGITYIGLDLNLELKLAIKEYYPTGYVARTNTTTSTVTPYRGEKADFFVAGRSRFINEAKTLARFYTLPGIVSVRDFFLENGTAYIVMEFVEGETLKQRLARVGGKMEASEVFELMRPLFRSLAEMHAAGLIHRDISPDNIMITPEGNIKLIDFGAARDYLDSGNRSLSVMLKPGFAPQEQYFTHGEQGPWTDIYALCATIYRAITGVTPPESVERLRKDELKAPSALGIAISPAQETALLKGLAVSQEERWQSIPELDKSLFPSDRLLLSKKPSPHDEDTNDPHYPSPKSEKEPLFARIKRKTIWLWTNKRSQVLITAGTLVLILVAFFSLPFLRGIIASQRVENYFSEDAPMEAIENLVQLQSISEERASKLIHAHAKEIYEYGVNQYHAEKIENAKEAFALLPNDFERTADYLLLIQVKSAYQAGTFKWKQSDQDDPERTLALQLINLVGFEDAGELVMQYHKSAVSFLFGSWREDTIYFKIFFPADDPQTYHATGNLPGCENVNGWVFVDGDFCTKNQQDDYEHLARFTILDKDTIEIFIYSTENTYTLHRE